MAVFINKEAAHIGHRDRHQHQRDIDRLAPAVKYEAYGKKRSVTEAEGDGEIDKERQGQEEKKKFNGRKVGNG